MEKAPIYTIGYGSRKLKDFLKMLSSFQIKYLIDVRSQPYSKFNPSFNQNELKCFLKNNGITYVFMGDTIGGRPNDVSCYDVHGKVDYETVRTKDFFINGIERLKKAYEGGHNVVLMCSESNPCECHRSKLIGKVLDFEKITIKHIDEKGKLKDQTSVINELNKGLSDNDLFGSNLNSTSRKAYL